MKVCENSLLCSMYEILYSILESPPLELNGNQLVGCHHRINCLLKFFLCIASCLNKMEKDVVRGLILTSNICLAFFIGLSFAYSPISRKWTTTSFFWLESFWIFISLVVCGSHTIIGNVNMNYTTFLELLVLQFMDIFLVTPVWKMIRLHNYVEIILNHKMFPTFFSSVFI